MKKFSAQLEIIDGNPFVFIPETILDYLFLKANKVKGHIPVYGSVNDKPYKRTLVKFRQHYRLYINMVMLINSPKRIGETIRVEIDFDAEERQIEMPPKFILALNKDKIAKKKFEELSPSRKKEIVRYIANLKNEESVDRNVLRAINFLNGIGRFVGREKP